MQNHGRELRGTPRHISQPPDRLACPPLLSEEINRMVLSQLERLPEIRMELVRSLRQAIRENRYSVPEERVAERMIDRCLAGRLN